MKLIFSGKGSPPPTLKDSNEVKRFIVNTAGGVGYMDEEDVDASLKVVLRVGE